MSGTDVSNCLKSVSMSSITKNTCVSFLIFTKVFGSLSAIFSCYTASFLIEPPVSYSSSSEGELVPSAVGLDGIIDADDTKTDDGTITSNNLVVKMFSYISVNFLRIMISLRTLRQQYELS